MATPTQTTGNAATSPRPKEVSRVSASARVTPEPATQGPLPLMLGITGHRDLRPEDEPKLEQKVESVFRQFQSRYPRTPLVLLSPLAEGADRLAARVALRCNVRLVVPLPMPQQQYVRDFDAASLAEFEALLAKAEQVFELPLIAGNCDDNIAEQNVHRSTQYAFVGAYIVQHCQLLIALWNGVPNNQCGGTGEVVDFQRKGIPTFYQRALARSHLSQRSFLDPVETGPVFHIVTPRRNSPEIEGEPLSLHSYSPEGNTEDIETTATYNRIFDNIEAFNRSALQLDSDPRLRAQCEQNAHYLIPDDIAATLDPALRQLRQSYAVADTLAQRYQRLTFRSLGWLCILSFVALLIFELTVKLAPNNGWLALLSPIVLGATYLCWHFTLQRGDWQDRYQDYRALAEGLRVQFFWLLAGLPNSVADHYLRKLRSELDWIRLAIRNMTGETPPHATPAQADSAARLAWEHWVENQARYFARSARRSDEEMERYESAVKALVTASPIVATLTALTLILPTPLEEWMHHHEIAHKLLIILVFVLAGVAGVLHTYADKRALSQHAKQYERMSSLFARAQHHMKQSAATEWRAEAQLIMLELGKEALAENGDWVMTHRERPVDVPHAG